MKTIIFSMIILATVLTACKKDSMSPPANQASQSVSVKDLPFNVTDFIANNYPAENIVSAYKVSAPPASMVVVLNTNEQVSFDSDGNALSGVAPTSDISPFITVAPTPVHFLPAAISNYLETNYAGYTIRSSILINTCNMGEVYDILLIQSGMEPVKVIFDLKGNYVAYGMRVIADGAPMPVMDYINKSFPGYTVMLKMEKFMLADGRIFYNVFVENGRNVDAVLVNADGTPVCVESSGKL
jgi:hypothetical protein